MEVVTGGIDCDRQAIRRPKAVHRHEAARCRGAPRVDLARVKVKYEYVCLYVF
eukprot:SAG25_NODE_7342_length_486_cov_1.516796_2_plen_52_part_01